MLKRQLLLSLAFLAVCLCGPAAAADERIAIGGYDPVAYFTESKPVKGNPRHQFVFDGATYQFSKAKHLEMFRKEPDRYTPVYRGLCTFALSRGVVVTANPEAWVIHNGQLHLFAGASGHFPKEPESTFVEAASQYEEMGRPKPVGSE